MNRSKTVTFLLNNTRTIRLGHPASTDTLFCREHHHGRCQTSQLRQALTPRQMAQRYRNRYAEAPANLAQLNKSN